MEDPVVRANRLKSVLNSDSYKTTIGQWLLDIKEADMRQLIDCDDDDEKRILQGSLRVIRKIETMISSVLSTGEKKRVATLRKSDG